MSRGELLTRLTVWLALCGYFAGTAMMLLAWGRGHRLACARWAWTFGCACFLSHVVSAFAFYHGWSHTAAYRETARQTAELTGHHWGGGIFLNYLFAALWTGDVLWWWLCPAGFMRRSPRLTAAWQAFLLFMVFNGTVVFGNGPVRWFGAVISVSLAMLWWMTRRQRTANS